MKLKIFENRYLLEDIAAVKKYYPNIDDATFMQLIALDPTYRDGSNSLGKYGKWILNLYNKGAISEEDFSEISPLLQQFTTYRNRIQNKDLNSYKSLQELSDILAAVVEDDSMLSPRQKVRFLKNVKAGRVQISAEDDYDVVLETPKFIVYVPNTHEASMKLGKGTKWCTAHENPDWYNKYTDGGGKLYIIRDKQTGSRYQYSDETDDFLDDTDSHFNWFQLLNQDKKLYSFMNKLNPKLFKIYTEDDLNYVYDGTQFYGDLSLKDVIEKITIPSHVERLLPHVFRHFSNVKYIFIPNTLCSLNVGAFEQCTSLETVEFESGSNIKKIEKDAFCECTSLKDINLPDSVERIDNRAFSNCSALAQIRLPDNLKNIQQHAFAFCDKLLKINIPNSVESIGAGVFYKCNNLVVYTDNEYAIEYCKEHSIPVKSASEYRTESFRHGIKLRIAEK